NGQRPPVLRAPAAVLLPLGPVHDLLGPVPLDADGFHRRSLPRSEKAPGRWCPLHQRPGAGPPPVLSLPRGVARGRPGAALVSPPPASPPLLWRRPRSPARRGSCPTGGRNGSGP